MVLGEVRHHLSESACLEHNLQDLDLSILVACCSITEAEDELECIPLLKDMVVSSFSQTISQQGEDPGSLALVLLVVKSR